jgi:hypothetical protein
MQQSSQFYHQQKKNILYFALNEHVMMSNKKLQTSMAQEGSLSS